MNSLSWFLYLADVLPNLGGTFGIIGIVGIVVSLLTGLLATIAYGDGAIESDAYAAIRKTCYKVLAGSLISILISAFIPSKDTIYLIAGSEAGEYVVNTPEAQAIIDDIHEVIRHQLSELKSDEGE